MDSSKNDCENLAVHQEGHAANKGHWHRPFCCGIGARGFLSHTSCLGKGFDVGGLGIGVFLLLVFVGFVTVLFCE